MTPGVDAPRGHFLRATNSLSLVVIVSIDTCLSIGATLIFL